MTTSPTSCAASRPRCIRPCATCASRGCTSSGSRPGVSERAGRRQPRGLPRDRWPADGLELSADACLAATDGTSTYERGADGVRLPGTTVVEQEPVDGGTLELTIDSDVQWFAQQAIAEQGSAIGAEWATAVVVSVDDGYIIAAGRLADRRPQRRQRNRPRQPRLARVHVAVRAGVGHQGRHVRRSARLGGRDARRPHHRAAALPDDRRLRDRRRGRHRRHPLHGRGWR